MPRIAGTDKAELEVEVDKLREELAARRRRGYKGTGMWKDQRIGAPQIRGPARPWHWRWRCLLQRAIRAWPGRCLR